MLCRYSILKFLRLNGGKLQQCNVKKSLQSHYLLLVSDKNMVLISALYINRHLSTSTIYYASKKPIIKKESVTKYNLSKPKKPIIDIWHHMTFSELSKNLGISLDDIFEYLLNSESIYKERFSDDLPIKELGEIVNIVQYFEHKPKVIGKPTFNNKSVSEDKDVYRQPTPDPSSCVSRPPVVTIMGHVDHGKTTLLDALRHSQIVQSEFGGITQHIGAFLVKLPGSSHFVTFLDTPGHAAFASMRQRGAQITDICVLVVAADDGVMPQTLESLKFASSAGVPIIVAINKCDKPDADIERTKRMLLEQNVLLEEYGGDVQSVCISALKGKNLDGLQEAILAQADIMDLKSDPNGLVEGVCVESKTAHGKGKVATILVQRGTLKKGAILIAGLAYCRVRLLTNEHGQAVDKATPSIPVEVTGWRNELPSAGDVVLQVQSENRAREAITWRQKQINNAKIDAESVVIEIKREQQRQIYQQNLAEKYEMGFRNRIYGRPPPPTQLLETVKTDKPCLSIIIKGDVWGSVEALLDVLNSYNSQKCQLSILDHSVGVPTENDLEMAQTFQCIIYCFNVDISLDFLRRAAEIGVVIKQFNIIYRLVEDIKSEFNSRLPLVDKEEVIGEGRVIKEFVRTEKGHKVAIAGCLCVKGQFLKKCRIKFKKDGIVYYDGDVVSMQKDGELVQTAVLDDEVGIIVDDKQVRYNVDDIIICYKIQQVRQIIDWSPIGF